MKAAKKCWGMASDMTAKYNTVFWIFEYDFNGHYWENWENFEYSHYKYRLQYVIYKIS